MPGRALPAQEQDEGDGRSCGRGSSRPREQEQAAKISDSRRSQVGGGDRSEKIRTYNFPQDRVTDHRVGYTRHNLQAFLDGDIDDVIDAVATADQAQRLEDSLE